jgi:hypothetical protein
MGIAVSNMGGVDIGTQDANIMDDAIHLMNR